MESGRCRRFRGCVRSGRRWKRRGWRRGGGGSSVEGRRGPGVARFLAWFVLGSHYLSFACSFSLMHDYLSFGPQLGFGKGGFFLVSLLCDASS